MATITRYVDPNSTGGNGTTNALSGANAAYASLSAWNAAEAQDLTAGGGNIMDVICSSVGGAADSTFVVVDGWTTDATHYIRIRVDSGSKHDGKVNTAKYRLAGSKAFGYMFRSNEQYVRVEGFQISNTHSAGDPVYFEGAGGGDCRLVDTIVYDSPGTNQAINNTSVVLTCINTIVQHCGGDGFYANTNGTIYYGCASVNNAGAGIRITGFKGLTATNCYAGGNTGADYLVDSNGTMTCTTCFSEDGTNSTTTAAFATGSGARFTNVTPGSEDLHIGSSSTLKNAGTDISSTITGLGYTYVDIDGDARGTGAGATDVGPDEFASSSPPATPTGLTIGSTTTTTQPLTWTAAATATEQTIKWYDADMALVNSHNMGDGTTQSYTVTGLTEGSQYFFTITASNAGGSSAESSTVTAFTLPVAPSSLVVASLFAGSFSLTFTRGSTHNTGVEITYSTASDFSASPVTLTWAQGDATATVASNAFTVSTTYYFRMRVRRHWLILPVAAASSMAYSGSATGTDGDGDGRGGSDRADLKHIV